MDTCFMFDLHQKTYDGSCHMDPQRRHMDAYGYTRMPDGCILLRTDAYGCNLSKYEELSYSVQSLFCRDSTCNRQ